MSESIYEQRLSTIAKMSEELIVLRNEKLFSVNGIYNRYKNPIITRAHIPLDWRYEMNPKTNPWFMERIGFNATFNAGAIKWKGKYLLVVRVEGNDRKSFFAIAESPTGIDNFRFWDRPISFPETENPDINVYDMRLTPHDDGWIYGVFCAERKDPKAPNSDTSAAIASAGIVRTKDLVNWERLPDLISSAGQQRNVVLFPHLINGHYGFYTRSQDGFIDIGSGGGIGFGLSKTIENAQLNEELIVDPKTYHTIYEAKNGLGPTPIRTNEGWLQLAHGVRNTAAGLRYTLYVFLTDFEKPWVVTHKPAGHLIAPLEKERIGDVSNVTFSNGWIADDDGTVYIYYASSDTRIHVATSSISQLLDYVKHTPEDGLRSAKSVEVINALIDINKASRG